MAEEAAEDEGGADDDGYYDPAPPAPTEIGSAPPRKRAPRKPKP